MYSDNGELSFDHLLASQRALRLPRVARHLECETDSAHTPDTPHWPQVSMLDPAIPVEYPGSANPKRVSKP